jgi:Raf kinase inhibitor-like YbhB/YbcL family protein
MKRIVVSILVVFGVVAANVAGAEQLSVGSPQFEPGGRLAEGQVFSGFGCGGKNTSPALQWKGAPKNTKSFAVTVYDPDAPTGSGWWHWVIFNIPADADRLAENAGDPGAGLAPKGSTQSRTDYGKPGYGGPCPPQGDKPHRYEFTVFALDTERLDLDPDSSAAMVGFFLHQHMLEKATLTGYYSR